jgi:23S rRNA pseudouridine2604 synthase
MPSAGHPPPMKPRRPGRARTPSAGGPPQHQGHAQAEAGNRDLPRLSKRMSELGLASRREADEWIAAGWVRVDGVIVDTLGARVRPDQHIEIDTRARREQSERVTVLLHKPVGYVSGQAEDGYRPAIVLVTPENRWPGDRVPIDFSRAHLRGLAVAGRLDIDSTGLLVLTQDGRIARQLIGVGSSIEKEYLVRVAWPEAPRPGPLNETFPAERLQLLRHGLSLDGVQLKPAKVSWQNEDQLRFVLREGRKRQIRRMCEAVGLRVAGLKRVRIGRVVLGALPPGQWRYLHAGESFG